MKYLPIGLIVLLLTGAASDTAASVTLPSDTGTALSVSGDGTASLSLGELGVSATAGMNSHSSQSEAFSGMPAGASSGAVASILVSGPTPIDGDVNLDGCVDFADFLIIQVNFAPGIFGAARTDGDLNGDGQVDFSDFLILQVNFGNKLIPEPGSLLVWCGMLACVGGVVRRSRSLDSATTS